MEDDEVLIDIEGSLQGGPESEELKRAVREALGGGSRKIVLNLAEVPWMNSSGIGALFACYLAASQSDGQLALLNVPKKIQNVIEVTHLDQVFAIHADEEAAIKSFAAS